MFAFVNKKEYLENAQGKKLSTFEYDAPLKIKHL